MIAQEDHDCSICDTGGIEGVEDFSELGVHVGYIGEVTMPHFGGLFGSGAFLVFGWSEDFCALVEGDIWCIFGAGIKDWWQFVSVVEVPVFFGCIELSMRFPEADREKEGL